MDVIGYLGVGIACCSQEEGDTQQEATQADGWQSASGCDCPKLMLGLRQSQKSAHNMCILYIWYVDVQYSRKTILMEPDVRKVWKHDLSEARAAKRAKEAEKQEKKAARREARENESNGSGEPQGSQ